MSELLILRGIPASGKSTFAVKWVAESPGTRARVNRDDIRFQLFGKYWGVDEVAVTRVQDASLEALLKAGKDVCLDNTNLKERDVKSVMQLAYKCGATVAFHDFPIHVEAAVERDSKRERQVGEEVIRNFYQRFTRKGNLPAIPTIDIPVSNVFEPYVYTPGLPHCIIVDIDGTLANIDHRSPYDHTRYNLDSVHNHVADIVSSYTDRHKVVTVIMSGRDEIHREVTEKWLNDNELNFNEFYMRWHEEGNKKTEDSIVKNALFQEYIAGRYNVDFVLDDRDRVVNMWRAKGLKCLQVAPGAF